MKPSTVAQLVAIIIALSELALVLTQIPPLYDTSVPFAMFLCTSLICRAIEEYRK